MKIRCPKCSRRLAISDEHAGRKVRCPECQATLAVPAPKPSAEPGENVADDPGPVSEDWFESEEAVPLRPSGVSGPRLRASGSTSQATGGPRICPNPSCQTPLPPNSVLCFRCGTNAATGQRPPSTLATAPSVAAPVSPGSTTDPGGFILVALGTLLHAMFFISMSISVGMEQEAAPLRLWIIMLVMTAGLTTGIMFWGRYFARVGVDGCLSVFLFLIYIKWSLLLPGLLIFFGWKKILEAETVGVSTKKLWLITAPVSAMLLIAVMVAVATEGGESGRDKGRRHVEYDTSAPSGPTFEERRALREAGKALSDVRGRWGGLRSQANDTELLQYAEAEYRDALKVADQGAAKAQAGDLGSVREATQLFERAIPMLEAAIVKANRAARRQKNEHLAPFLLERAEAAFQMNDRFAIEGMLCRLDYYIGGDDRLPPLRSRADAIPWPGDLTVDLGQGLEMTLVAIRPGTFTMGSADGRNDEKPPHTVTISRPFYMARLEVTREQWHAVMGDDPDSRKHPRHPASGKTWPRCQEFMGKLGERYPNYVFRLPTEAEWEYACRAGSTTRYSCGDSIEELGQYAWHEWNSGRQTHDVGLKRPNAWGLYDMHGCIEEWCHDWYDKDYYSRSPAIDPSGPTYGEARVLRGGSGGHNPREVRSSIRIPCGPTDLSYHQMGFRVVAEPLASRDFLLKAHAELQARGSGN